MKKFFSLWMCIVCLGSGVCVAQEALHQIELIVFENRQLPVGEIEKSQRPKPSPEITHSKELAPASFSLDTFQLLPRSQLSLLTEAANIAHDPNYNLLLHIAWTQPIDNQTITPIHIYAPESESNTHELIPYKTLNDWKLDGVISLSKTKYYEVKTDLILKKSPKQNNEPYAGAFRNDKKLHYYMNLIRRINGSELHYFDNPVFGVLIKITPITQVVSQHATD